MDEGSHNLPSTGPDQVSIDLPNDHHASFIKKVYLAMDEAVRHEINRLYDEEGIIPSCKPGCFLCCSQHILLNITEAVFLADYIRREFSPDQIEGLKTRTFQWHKWDETRRMRGQAEQNYELSGAPAHGCCPMLVDGKCSAYSVRPLTCRTHYVCTSPECCGFQKNPESIKNPAVVITSVINAANPFLVMIRNNIKSSGLDYNDSIMLLPHWLAVEMKWDFSVVS
mgnify:CR=1 FL=1|jgi:Fe-S-cluster containining protein